MINEEENESNQFELIRIVFWEDLRVITVITVL